MFSKGFSDISQEKPNNLFGLTIWIYKICYEIQFRGYVFGPFYSNE